MANPHYIDLQTADDVAQLVTSACDIEDSNVIAITDEDKLRNEVIYTLQFNASVGENEEVKQSAIGWINAIAQARGIEPWTNNDFYDEKQSGQHEFFTVPAVNARMVAFHKVRAAIKAADALGLPHIIFELAVSEVGYTGQQKDEYAALVKAAYISLGVTNRKIYIQADHYQLDPKKYAADREAEVKRLQDLIEKALESGVYNIDIDTSKFETADEGKSDRENQGENARLTAELFHFIRQYEKDHDLPCVVSIGGEVGEVGGENTQYPQVNAYLEMVKERATELGSGETKGLSKISINVGSAHGGVLGSDGKPLDTVPLNFTAHHDLYMKGSDPMNPQKHVLPVQHGASTLPKKYFSLFPAMHTAEIHLATGFQNIVWDVLEKEDATLHEKMKTMVYEKFGDKIAGHKTEAIGFIKERKRVTEFFKRELLLTDCLDSIEKELERDFSEIFNSLYNVLANTKGHVEQGDRDD